MDKQQDKNDEMRANQPARTPSPIIDVERISPPPTLQPIVPQLPRILSWPRIQPLYQWPLPQLQPMPIIPYWNYMRNFYSVQMMTAAGFGQVPASSTLMPFASPIYSQPMTYPAPIVPQVARMTVGNPSAFHAFNKVDTEKIKTPTIGNKRKHSVDEPSTSTKITSAENVPDSVKQSTDQVPSQSSPVEADGGAHQIKRKKQVVTSESF